LNYEGAKATLNSCEFIANTSPKSGGAICSIEGATATITGCTFTLNAADEAGGAIYGDSSKYLIANSTSEFSDTQNQDDWYYGYYDGDDPFYPYTNADFEQLPLFDEEGWRWYIDGYWTALWDSGGHPHGSPEQWVVRRWVSEVDGTVIISGELAKEDDGGGDGIVGHILLDGAVVASQSIAFDDTEGVYYSVYVDVSIGSLVDFAIAPYESAGNDWNDGSRFTAYIEEVPPSEYPMVSHCILWDNSSENGPQVAVISTEDIIQSAPEDINVQTVQINDMGHITDITVDPATGSAWVLGFKMENIPYQPTATDSAFYEPYIAEIPYESTGPVDANCLSDSYPGPSNDLALPLSIVWTGTAKCGGVDLDGSGVVNLADFAVFTAYWLDSGCVLPNNWCAGCDLDPVFLDRGDVNVIDLAIFAQHWLETCSYPQ